MLRTIIGKVVWLAKGAALFWGAALTLALVFGAATMALGANGGNFILGQGNAATALTRLTGDVQGAAMQIINTDAGADDTALNLQTQDGEAPMRVTSDAKVANLNADKLDGQEPSQIKGAKAYAVVDSLGGPGDTPILDPDFTSGFTSVDRIAEGFYCLTAPGLDAANRPALTSVDWASTQIPEATASAMVRSGGCSGGRFRVITERTVLTSGGLSDTTVNDVSFVIAVP